MKAVSYWVAIEEAEPFASPEEGVVIHYLRLRTASIG
jgi:hypothetical protein